MAARLDGRHFALWCHTSAVIAHLVSCHDGQRHYADEFHPAFETPGDTETAAAEKVTRENRRYYRDAWLQ